MISSYPKATSDNNLITGAYVNGSVTIILPGALQQAQTWSQTAGPAAAAQLYVVLIGANDAINAAVNNLNPTAKHIDESQLAVATLQRIKSIVELVKSKGQGLLWALCLL